MKTSLWGKMAVGVLSAILVANCARADWSIPGSSTCTTDADVTAALTVIDPAVATLTTDNRAVAAALVSLAATQGLEVARQAAKQIMDVSSSMGGTVGTHLTVGGGIKRLQSGQNNRIRSQVGLAHKGPAAGHPSNLADKWQVWGEGFGFWADQDRRKGQEGYDMDSGGVIVGLQRQINPNLFLGFDFAYAATDIDMDRNLGGADLDTFDFSLTGTYAQKAWYVDFGTTYGFTDNDTIRNIPALAYRNKADFTSHQWSIYGDYGYVITNGKGFKLTPEAGLRYAYYWQPDYKESGSDAALRIDDFDQSFLVSSLGVDVAYEFKPGNVVITPSISYTWEHQYIDENKIKYGFANVGGVNYTGEFDLDDNLHILGTAIRMKMAKTAELWLGYDLQLKDEFVGHKAYGGLGISF